MEFTRHYLPMEWEERWRKEKERRRMVIEEGGEKVEEENRRLQWIKAYNDRRLGIKEKVMMTETTVWNKENGRDMKQKALKYSSNNFPTEIFQAMEEMRQCALLTDLTLSLVNGNSFHVHSLVLAAVSSVVQQTLQERHKKNNRDLFIQVNHEVSSLGVSAVLEFAYTGTVTGLNCKTLTWIQSAAHHLGVPRLVALCKEVEEKEKKMAEGTKVNEKRKNLGEEQVKVSLQSIRKLWEKGVGCDVELEAEGRIFQAHRVLLSASSNYFHAMFLSGMRESQQASVSLLLMGAPELDALLHYCYSGELFLDWCCIFEVASSALQFQFLPVLSLCISYLESEMDIYNCLDVLSFSEAYMLSELLKMAEDFIHIHFQEVVTTPKFLELPAQTLLDLIKHDALCVPSELATFRAVVAWIEADPARRLPQAQEVMEGVRFPLMTFREFREVRAVNLRIECSADEEICLYRSALKEFGLGGYSPEVRRRKRYPKYALVIVGGDQLSPDNGKRLPSKQLWFANSLRSGTGLVKDMEWRILGEMPEQARFRHGVGVLEGKLYVAGGCHYYSKADTMKSVYRYDPSNNSWDRLSDMQEHRSNFIMVVGGDSLYAIGGDRDISNNLDSVEKYSPDTDTWSFSHPLDQPISGHAAVIWNGEIFISGGFNCKYQCLVSLFLYHPEQGTTYLADMSHDRAQHCMETLAKRFYVAGGVSNLRNFYGDQLSCESYDPVTDSWTEFTCLPLPHVGGASAVLEEKLYVLGGYCQEDYSEARLIHRYDPGTQKWGNIGHLDGPVTDIRACLLCLPAYLRK